MPITTSVQQILEANLNLRERIMSKGLQLAYDDDTDMLLIDILDESAETIGEHLADNAVVHSDIGNNRITGWTVFSFTHFAAKHKLSNLAVRLKEHDGKLELRGEQATTIVDLFQTIMTNA